MKSRPWLVYVYCLILCVVIAIGPMHAAFVQGDHTAVAVYILCIIHTLHLIKDMT